jgi:hypothetical protein
MRMGMLWAKFKEMKRDQVKEVYISIGDADEMAEWSNYVNEHWVEPLPSLGKSGFEE